VKFSVVTVSYNAEATIERTIRSVRAQTGVSFEHILIDGGSNDGTMDIVGRYRDGFSVIVSAKDRGVYDGMNKGLALARGEYCGFLNADDYFAGQSSLRALDVAVGDAHWAGVYGVVDQIDTTGRTKRRIGMRKVTSTGLLWGQIAPHPSTYLRTSIMRDLGGFDLRYRLCADVDMFVRIFDRTGEQIAHTQSLITKMQLGGLSTQGLPSYRRVGAELNDLLTRSGRKTSNLRVGLRGFYKLRELLFTGQIS
jgi:glycosyltransferase involved in cell wall biosynthesis